MIDLRWTTLASEDFERTVDQAMALDIGLSAELIEQVEHANAFLAQNPRAGSPWKSEDRRKWRLDKLPFALIYRIEPNQLLVIRLVHLRSDWQSLP